MLSTLLPFPSDMNFMEIFNRTKHKMTSESVPLGNPLVKIRPETKVVVRILIVLKLYT